MEPHLDGAPRGDPRRGGASFGRESLTKARRKTSFFFLKKSRKDKDGFFARISHSLVAIVFFLIIFYIDLKRAQNNSIHFKIFIIITNTDNNNNKKIK